MAVTRTPEEQRAADIERAKMLFTKAERASTDAEAEAFSEAAERLMIRLGIDRALIEATIADEGKREEVVTHTFTFTRGDPLMEVNFVGNIAGAFGLQAVQWTTYNGGKATEVFGHESDIANLITVYTSLRQQADTGRVRWENRSEAVYDAKLDKDRSALRRLRRGYMLGFSTGATERITASVAKVTQEATTHIPGAALVLVDRKAVVKAKLAETYPKLGTARRFTSDRRASHAGYRDGQQARTGSQSEIGGSRAALSGR